MVSVRMGLFHSLGSVDFDHSIRKSSRNKLTIRRVNHIIRVKFGIKFDFVKYFLSLDIDDSHEVIVAVCDYVLFCRV